MKLTELKEFMSVKFKANVVDSKTNKKINEKEFKGKIAFIGKDSIALVGFFDNTPNLLRLTVTISPKQSVIIANMQNEDFKVFLNIKDLNRTRFVAITSVLLQEKAEKWNKEIKSVGKKLDFDGKVLEFYKEKVLEIKNPSPNGIKADMENEKFIITLGACFNIDALNIEGTEFFTFGDNNDKSIGSYLDDKEDISKDVRKLITNNLKNIKGLNKVTSIINGLNKLGVELSIRNDRFNRAYIDMTIKLSEKEFTEQNKELIVSKIEQLYKLNLL